MKILWIGSLAWSFQGQYEFPINGPGAVSGSCFEQNIIGGLEALGCDIDIIADYPYDPKVPFTKGGSWSHNGVSSDYRLPHYKSKYTSLFLKQHMLKKVVRRKLAKSTYDFVFIYLIHYPYLAILPQVRQLCKAAKTVLVCPDLPDMMDMSLKDKAIKSFLKKIDMRRISRKYKYLDAFVLFAESMKDRLPIYSRPYFVLEGVSSVDNLDITPVKKAPVVLHAGTLHRNIGIENIIQSFKYIDNPNLELWIFGTGELVEYIEETSKVDDRIKYKGFVNRNDLFEYIKQAKILINARNPADAYTKYSFPSKTFEYIYSGTPFLSTKLDGIPEEYWAFMYQLEDNSPTTIARAIQDVVSKSEFVNIDKARDFIITEKGKGKQSKRLYDFLTTL